LTELAKKMPHGQDRDAILRKIRQVQTASHFNELMISPGLQAPTLSKEYRSRQLAASFFLD